MLGLVVMVVKVLLAFAVLCCTALPVIASQRNFGSGSEPARYMRVYGPTDAPFGFVQFCARQPRECISDDKGAARVAATPAALAELDYVNRFVNRTVQPVTDRDQYGVDEYWTIPGARGDCEDYALLKKRTLVEREWPTAALLITVVLDEERQGHAILTARTDAGDLILDNKHDELKLWHQTPYQFLMRQSSVNPMVWMSLDPASSKAPSVASGDGLRNEQAARGWRR